MGNTISEHRDETGLNQFENIPTLHFHGVYCSRDVELLNFNQEAVIPPFSKHKVIYLNKKLSTATRVRYFSLTFRVKFGHGSVPVIGFGLRLEKYENIILETNPNLYLWDITDGSMIIKGIRDATKKLPKCKDGCIVQCSIDMGSGRIDFAVKNPKEVQKTESVTVIGIPDEVWPLVGVLTTGNSSVSFDLQSFDQRREELYDLTMKTMFTDPCGVLELSADCKTVFRESTQEGNSCVLVNRVMQSGIHHWTLQVDCDFGASLCLGLTKVPFHFSDRLLSDPLHHIYRHQNLIVWRSYRGLLYVSGKQQELSIEPLGWQNNSSVTVEFHLDFSNGGTLEIVRKGKSLGVVFRGISGPVQPIVAFYAAYEKKVTLLDYRTSEHSAETSTVDVAKDGMHMTVESKPSFDPSSKYGAALISDDRMSLQRSKDQSGNAYCLLNQTCASGEYRWSFIIESDQGASTCLGVAKEPIELADISNLYTCTSMYLFRSFQGMLYREGRELSKRFEEYWQSNSLVELILDFDGKEGVLQCVVNGRDQGIAFANIRPPVKPIVGFYSGMEKRITLIHYEHKEKTLPVQELKTMFNDLSIKTAATGTEVSMIAKKSHANQYYEHCMVCGAFDMNVISLPCKHAVFCPEHISVDGTQTCLICDQPITGAWNILAD